MLKLIKNKNLYLDLLIEIIVELVNDDPINGNLEMD